MFALCERPTGVKDQGEKRPEQARAYVAQKREKNIEIMREQQLHHFILFVNFRFGPGPGPGPGLAWLAILYEPG